MKTRKPAAMGLLFLPSRTSLREENDLCGLYKLSGILALGPHWKRKGKNLLTTRAHSSSKFWFFSLSLSEAHISFSFGFLGFQIDGFSLFLESSPAIIATALTGRSTGVSGERHSTRSTGLLSPGLLAIPGKPDNLCAFWRLPPKAAGRPRETIYVNTW